MKQRKNTRKDKAMHEQDQPSNDERDLERIFAHDLGAEALPTPPPDLADRIKAQIPADLGRAQSKPKTAVVPFWRDPKILALAATMVLAVGLWVLMPEVERPVESLSPVEPRSDVEPTNVGALPTSLEESMSETEDGAVTTEVEERVSQELRSNEIRRRRQELKPVETTANDDAKTSVEPIGAASARERGVADRAPSAPRALRIPIPDPTPDEPSPVSEAPHLPLRDRRSASPPASAPAPRLELKEEIEVRAPPPKPLQTLRPTGSDVNRQPDAESEPEPEGLLRARHESRDIPKPRAKLQPPNDAAHDAMFFDSAGVNPFVDTEDDALSTFGLDVDTASYTVTRRYLQDGNLPPKDAVRVEEMLNFFDYGDPLPSTAEGDFALHADVAPSRWAPDANRSERYYLVRFGLRARDVLAAERPPALLTFVVDVSGSMAREDRLGLVKRALGLLVENLREDDRVALVVYGSRGRVLLEPTSDHQAVRAAIDRLRPEGSTNAAEGLRLGYELTARHRRPGHIHRVILCSDGVANVGTTTSGEGILGEVERWGEQGVELTTVGFGMGNYNDTLMETLADQGNGRYAYVDSLDEARRFFAFDLTGTLTTVAAEARAQVAFDPEIVSRYRLLGYENRDIADERFRDDTVDAGEIGAGHSATALYEVKTRRPLRKRDRLATLTLRYASIARGEMVEQSLPLTGRDAADTFAAASRSLRLAATVAEFAEVLRGSYWARDVDLGEVFAEAQKVSADWPGDLDVAEFATLVGKAERLREAQ